jgi:hypothetical protein
VARKRPIYIDFKKRQEAATAFVVNPESDPNMNPRQKLLIINALQSISHRIIYLDFKGKKAIPEGFNVEKKNDANETYRKNRLLLDEVYGEKKYKLPPGPRCPKEGKIIAAAHHEGPYHSIDHGFYILAAVRHTQECTRCQAIYDKARLEKSCRIESHEESKDND